MGRRQPGSGRHDDQQCSALGHPGVSAPRAASGWRPQVVLSRRQGLPCRCPRAALAHGSLVYPNSRRSPRFVRRESQSLVKPLPTHGAVLGVIEDISLERGRRDLEPADAIVQNTDGVIELSNSQREKFGRGWLQAMIARTSQMSCEHIVTQSAWPSPPSSAANPFPMTAHSSLCTACLRALASVA
jgi:hypothetical protein